MLGHAWPMRSRSCVYLSFAHRKNAQLKRKEIKFSIVSYIEHCCAGGGNEVSIAFNIHPWPQVAGTLSMVQGLRADVLDKCL